MPVTTRAQRPADHRRLTGALLTVTAILAVAVLWLKPAPFSAHTDVRARFNDVSGLSAVGADVRVAGVKVGEVRDRTRDGASAVLTLRLDADAPQVHTDARAALRPTLLFEGRAFIDLDPGTARTPALHGVLALARTRTYVPLADALEALGRTNATHLRRVLRGARTTLAPAAQRALRGSLQQAPALTATLARTAGAARGPHATELRSATRHLAATADAVAARADALPAIVHGTDRTLAALTGPQTHATGAALGAALQRLPQTVRDLRSASAALQGTVTDLRPLARDLRPALRAAAPTLDALLPVLRGATPALTRVTPLLGNLRGALDAGRVAAGPTRRVVAAAKPTVAVLDDSLLGALERKTTLGTPAYQAFLGLFAGGGGASRPFGGGGAAGHFMRFGFRFITGAAAPLPPCDLLVKASPQLAQAFSAAGACTP